MPGEAELPPPVVLSLMVSNNGTYDNVTGRYSLEGTLSGFEATGFPCAMATFCIYAALTNGRSEVTLTIRLVDTDEQRPPLVEVRAPLLFSNPRDIREVMFTFPGLLFRERGTYRIQIFAAGQLLAERQLEVFQAETSSD